MHSVSPHISKLQNAVEDGYYDSLSGCSAVMSYCERCAEKLTNKSFPLLFNITSDDLAKNPEWTDLSKSHLPRYFRHDDLIVRKGTNFPSEKILGSVSNLRIKKYKEDPFRVELHADVVASKAIPENHHIIPLVSKYRDYLGMTRSGNIQSILGFVVKVTD